MPTSDLKALLERTRGVAARRAEDVSAKYGRFAMRVVRGEKLDPDAVLTTLTALNVSPDRFAEDVEVAAARLDLKGVADQLPERAASARAAEAKVREIGAEYAAAAEALRQQFAEREVEAEHEARAAGAAEREADAARAKLVSGCRDVELKERLTALQLELNVLRTQADAIHEEVRVAEALTAQAVPRKTWDGFTGPEHPTDLQDRTRRAESAREGVSNAPDRLAAITARRAEADAEIAALEPRLLEPWPVGTGPLK
jgi:hypothetical protein